MKKPFLQKVVSLRDGFLDFLFPPKCAVCGRVGYFGLCPACRDHVTLHFDPKKYRTNGGTGHADAMFTLFPYENEAVRRLLFDWKNVRYPDLPVIFRPYLEKGMSQSGFPRTLHAVTYLPRRRRARRIAGFDQAEEIARLVAGILNVPLVPLLARRGFSRPQRKLPFAGREQNVRGVFHPLRQLSGESVLLVDDIVTTGAGAREGARILKKAGAMKVFVLSLAH